MESRSRWVVVFGLALLCLLVLTERRFRLALVFGPSMQPTLHTGHLLLIDKRAYRDDFPQRGDLVLARYRHELIVKRVVGLPGEAVELKHGHLYVNGQAVSERHPVEPGPLNIAEGKLLSGRIALLGDNRSLSSSQIVSAVIPKEQVIGKVVLAL